ncbi:RDD family protein [Mucilaginibacter corticis]|uniref:RDD family protein n=1 Tax=Mucilaginibacter corticis TaxID=2597670 RepID=A0A556MS87_9SPHI|nr:RDD family protein [Mucilaginibacter corticis]TSJ42810.1 RDD family protein [Mucilaginibacter corticis]
MQIVKITTTQNIDIEYAVASLSERIAARFIDYAIFLSVYGVMTAALVGVYSDQLNSRGPVRPTKFVIMIGIWLGFCVLYDLLTEVFLNGQSLGKRFVKIKVISLNGTRPGIGQYLLRWFFRIIDFGLTMGAAAVVTVTFSDKKQRIGDMVAGTTVIKTAPLNRFSDLVFHSPEEGYKPTYKEVVQLTDRDVTLIHDVIRNFRMTRNSNLVYRLALRIKKYLNVNYPEEINEYQFLEIVLNDYNSLIANNGIDTI